MSPPSLFFCCQRWCQVTLISREAQNQTMPRHALLLQGAGVVCGATFFLRRPDAKIMAGC